MSSTSSSNCQNCNCSQCVYSLEDYYNNYSFMQYGNPMKSSRYVPGYTTMAHPLIYYAEVQRPLNKRQTNDQSRKENRNCFVKAFKWYTQERLPSNNTNENVPERSGFASWLDNKYIEYLREGRQCQPQNTAAIDPCSPGLTTPYEPCTTRRFARIRSPWRKRRRPCNDSGDVPDKCPPSCEFILQPKDLTRAASDNCYNSPTSGCNKSNATVVSSNMPANFRGSGKSHSLSSIYHEKSVLKHNIDTIPHTLQEGPKPQEPTKTWTPCCTCHREQIPQIVQVPSKSRAVDVWSQYPEKQVIPVNVETQYEPPSSTPNPASCCCFVDAGYTPMATPVKKQSRKILNPEINLAKIPSVQSNDALKKQKNLKQPSVSCQCSENIVRVDPQYQSEPDPGKSPHVCAPVNQPVHEINQMFGPKQIRCQSCSTVALNEETCEVIVKEVAVVSKFTRSFTIVANNAVQTSDHALSFEKGGACPYPLFLKIVCADRSNKLDNECF